MPYIGFSNASRAAANFVESALAPNVFSLIAGRTIAGVGIGIVSVVGTLYLAEVSPERIRGRLVSIYMTANMAGIICGYLIELVFDSDGKWQWILGFPVVVAVPFAVSAWALPETPRWLVRRGRIVDAKAALRRIHKTEDVDQELEDIEAGVGNRKGNWTNLLGADVRRALIICVGLGILQRMTGITIAFLYGPIIFEFAGMHSLSTDVLAGLGVGVAFLVGQVISLALVDRLGRRPLLILGYSGMVCGLVSLGAAFAMGEGSLLGQWMAVGGVMLLAGAWAVGPASVTYLLISELFPQHVRGSAMSVATVAIWLTFLFMTFTFLTTMEFLGKSMTFWAYALMSAVAIGAVYLFVPETKGRKLEEISASIVQTIRNSPHQTRS